LYLALLILPNLASAQFYDFVQVLENDTLDYPVNSFFPPSLVASPTHGTAYWDGGSGQGANTLVYVPNSNYLGRDTFTISFWGTVAYIERVIEVDVVAASVTVVNDYVTTTVDQTTTVDVLANDIGLGSGTVSLSNVSLVNYGSAFVDTNNHVVFTPNPTFIGTAHLNYTACLSGACDVGVLTVFVEDSGASVDTIYLSTNRATSKDVLLPLGNGYTLLESPNNGTVSVVNNGIIRYTPFNGFFNSTDKFTYQYNTNTNTSTAAFIINVLDTEIPNTFAKDDYSNVTIDGDVMIDAAANDNALLNPMISLLLVEAPQNGIALVINNKISYTPNAGFFGLDKLTYKSCVNNGVSCENADVYILVDNLKPSAPTFYLTTPQNTPLVLDYNLPFEDYDFVNVDAESDLGGVIDYLEGSYSGTIHGQDVDGFNLVVYTPPLDHVGEDRFEFDYCVGADCELVKVVVDVIPSPNANIDTFCVAECIWPGDANRDGIVDIGDLLPVGYCVGKVGPSRLNADLGWYGQFGADWGGTITSSRVDLKNVDTDGDGFIQASDTAAIRQSYGLTHSLTASTSIVSSTLPLFFVPQNAGPYNPGDLVLIDVILGNPAQPAIDISGLTFALNYNASIVEAGTFKVDFKSDSWLSYNTPTLNMVQFPFDGRAEAGISRTSGKAASGDGIVATVSFIIEDIIDGAQLRDTTSLRLRPSMPSIMNGNGQYENLPIFDLTINVTPKTGPPAVKEEQLLAYPNPSQEILNVHINGQNILQEVSLYTLTGQQVYFNGGVNADHTEINVSNFKNGLYLLAVKTEDGVVSKKIEIFKN